MIWLILAAMVVAAVFFLIGRYSFNPISTKVEPQKLHADFAMVSTLIKQERVAHDAYEHDRVHVRNRPGWHDDQREEVVVQRVIRELYKRGYEADEAVVRHMVKGR